uniref:Uncharacterized protein n=1 Tax=Manihot esculenta TaxID=3983 RepID=A0A2C9WF83_MANES
MGSFDLNHDADRTAIFLLLLGITSVSDGSSSFLQFILLSILHFLCLQFFSFLLFFLN